MLYDSVMGKPVFLVPQGRSFQEFVAESEKHGWPSFRDQEVIWQNVRCLADGEAVTTDGVHLGHNLPTRADTPSGWANRYCINLVSVAGTPSSLMDPVPLGITKRPSRLQLEQDYLCQPVLHAGFLEKKNRHGKWQRRWWELRPPYLVYYVTRPAGSEPTRGGASPKTPPKSPGGSKSTRAPASTIITLASVQDCVLAGSSLLLEPDVDVEAPPGARKSTLREITLVASDRTLALRASTAALAKAWARSLVVALRAVAHEEGGVAVLSSPGSGKKAADEVRVEAASHSPSPMAKLHAERESDAIETRPLAQSMKALESRFETVEASSIRSNLVNPSSDASRVEQDLESGGEAQALGGGGGDGSESGDLHKVPTDLDTENSDDRSNSMPKCISGLVDPEKLWPSNLQVEVSVAPKENGHPVYKTMVFWNGTEQPVCGGSHRFAVYRQLQMDLVGLGLESPVELSRWDNLMASFSGTPAPPAHQDTPASHRRGGDSGVEGQGQQAPVFPRTYRRNSFGIKLTEEQIQRRCQKLNVWLTSLVPDTPLPLRAAMLLADFLGLQELPYYAAWKRNQDARRDASSQLAMAQGQRL